MAKLKKAEFIEKWVEALTSGRFKQGKEYLKRKVDRKDDAKGDRYCCLGVACVVAAEIGLRNIDIEKHQKEQDEMLPNSLARFLNIEIGGSFKKAVVHRGNSYASLIELNDDGITFKTIAKIIVREMAAKNFLPFVDER